MTPGAQSFTASGLLRHLVQVLEDRWSSPTIQHAHKYMRGRAGMKTVFEHIINHCMCYSSSHISIFG